MNQFFIDDKFACGWAEVAERQKDLVVPDVISLLMGSDTVGGVKTKLIDRNTTIIVAQAALLVVKGFSCARSCVAGRHSLLTGFDTAGGVKTKLIDHNTTVKRDNTLLVTGVFVCGARKPCCEGRAGVASLWALPWLFGEKSPVVHTC